MVNTMEIPALERQGVEELFSFREAVYGSGEEFESFERAVQEGTGMSENPKRLGYAKWILGRWEEALEALEGARDRTSTFVKADCLVAMNRPTEAGELLEKAGGDTLPERLLRTKVLRKTGRLEEALDESRSLMSEYGDVPAVMAERARCLLCAGLHEDAAAVLEKALESAPEDVDVLFAAAYLAYCRGDDEKAVELYTRCVERRPVPVEAYVNLALLYDDAGKYEDAAYVLERVSRLCPSDERISFLAESSASSTHMEVDEEKQKRKARLEKLLSTPISDFELSIRSFKCLQQMGIHTLGDLVSKTETELLAFNNFGETSLAEVKAILKTKGLSLREEEPDPRLVMKQDVLPEEARGLSLEEAGLSPRIAKCLESAGIKTLGDVCSWTESELLELKDFGRASLRELKKKLVLYGLSLKSED